MPGARTNSIDSIASNLSSYARTISKTQITYSANLIHLIIITALNSSAFGCVTQAMPRILTQIYAAKNGFEFQCSDSQFDDKIPPDCQSGSNQAQFNVSLYTCFQQILILVCSPILGYMADRYGRRPFLVASMFLCVPSTIFFLLAQRTMKDDIFLKLYFITFSLNGILFTIPLTLTAASDVVMPLQRAGAFGTILGVLFVGYTAMPKLTNLVDDNTKCIISSSLMLSAAFYTLLFFRETKLCDVTAENQGVGTILLKSIKDMRILNRNILFRNLSFCVFFSMIVQEASFQLTIFYVQDNFSFSEDETSSLFLMLAGLSMLSQGVLLNPLVHVFGEKNVLLIAWFFGILHCLGYCYSIGIVSMFVSASMTCICYLCFPLISAIKSNNASDDEQGMVQGAVYSVRSLAAAVGPLTFNKVNDVKFLVSSADWLGLNLYNTNSLMWIFGALLYSVTLLFSVWLPKELANSRFLSKSNSESDLDLGKNLLV